MLLRVVLLVLAGALSYAQAQPSIQITSVSPFGSWPGYVTGTVLNVDPTQTNVTAMIFVSGLGYYVKPYCSPSSVPLNPDGSFNLLITTGGVDQTATRIAVFAVPANYTVQCYTAVLGIPPELQAAALAEAIVDRPNPAETDISFSDETWAVKTNPGTLGPGPNYFSDSPNNVFVDALGQLHLKIDNSSGQWQSAEVVTKRVYSYGTFSFKLQSSPTLDQNAVFGAFTWADAQNNSSEVDELEIGQFGSPGPTNAQFVVQPFTVAGNLHRLTIPAEAPTTYTMTWNPGSLVFTATAPDGSVIDTWTYPGTVPVPDSANMNLRFNLWLYNGQPPASGMPQEVVISDFHYQRSDTGAVRGDFDANQFPDLLWQNTTDGTVVIWYLGAGPTVLSANNLSGPVAGWHVVAVADINNDTVPDLIWQQDGTNTLGVWYMGGPGGAIPQSAFNLTGPVPGGWRVVAAADMNGDRIPDLIWQQDITNIVGIWYMGGDGTMPVSAVNVSGPVTGWRVVGAADMNRDGIPDLIWQEDVTNTPGVWFMGGPNGAVPQSAKNISGPVPGWRIVGVADLNGDGYPDLLWEQDTTNTPGYWLMGGADGTVAVAAGNFSGPVAGWRVVGPK